MMSAETYTGPRARAARFPLGWHVAWYVVFALNLPLPLFLGFALFPSDDTTRAGVAAAIPLAMALGHLAITRCRWLRGVLVCGGVGVALLQVLFVPHLVAGMLAAGLVSRFVDPTHRFAIGFWLTLLTGAQLVTAALGFGLPFYWLGTPTEVRKPS
jgi:hypothetical protein